MTRYFFNSRQQEGELVSLSASQIHHITHVLRLCRGDIIELCDESGRCYSAEIIIAEKEKVQCKLHEVLSDNEPTIKFSLAFGLLKGEKNDLVIQKAVELGASRLLPFYSRYTVVRLKENKAAARRERWQKIALAAAGQAKRNLVPAVETPVGWQELLSSFSAFAAVLFFWETAEKNCLAQALWHVRPGDKVLLVTGPEGGFSPAEAEAAQQQGARAIKLGPRIFRAETGALAALALSLYETGQMGGK